MPALSVHRSLVVVAVSAVALTASTSLPAAIAASAQPSHVAHAAFTGPPLGYYEQSVKDCIAHPHRYYHNRAFYKACRQDLAIVAAEKEGGCRWLGLASLLSSFIPGGGAAVQVGLRIFGTVVFAACI